MAGTESYINIEITTTVGTTHFNILIPISLIKTFSMLQLTFDSFQLRFAPFICRRG